MQNTTASHAAEQRLKFHDLLTGFSNAMLVTRGGDGGMHARPMAIARIEDDCSVWFITGSESGKTDEIELDNAVLIVCQKERSSYLSMSGEAELVRNQAKINELWQEPFKVWFPGGREDPGIELIHVTPDCGEFWDNKGLNKLQLMFQAAKAYAGGTALEVKEGEQHGSVRL